MAIESARAFIERMRTDASFRESMREAENREERWKLIKAAGLDFTKEELEQAKAEAAGKLSQEELEKVAGGTIPVVTALAVTATIL